MVAWPRASWSEQRRVAREEVYQPAWIELGGTRRDCDVSNISGAGAKLTVEKSMNVPDEFMLLLEGKEGVGRHCKVIWRVGLEVGVTFLPGTTNLQDTDYVLDV